MSRSRSPSMGNHYGLARACAAWKFPRSTCYAQRNRSDDLVPPRKHGPKTPFTDAELTERIGKLIAASPFRGEGHCKIWAACDWRAFEHRRSASST